jgi:hypothetical protein
MLAAWTTPRSAGRDGATLRTVTHRWRTPATTAVQEDPVHPDLYLIVYRQQERELEHRLEHRRSQATRDGARTRRGARPHPFAAVTARRRQTAG